MRYFSHTPEEIESMLKVIGKSDVTSLFDSIPDAAKNKSNAGFASLTEMELMGELEKRADHRPRACFIGAGATRHFVPQIVSQQLLRSEWYTAYTPYQPEVAQGTLQAIFEFQTMVASLFGCDVANASMYDGATALAEAMLMAVRIKRNKKTILVSRAVHPEYREVCKSFLEPLDLQLIAIPIGSDGKTDGNQLKAALDEYGADIAAVAFQTPNFLGCLENQREIVDNVHQNGSLAIAANTEPLAYAMYEPPGSEGADIVIGEGIGFCGHLSLGAPGVGLFACKKEFVRQMPGRLVGQSVDEDGKRAFVLTLATREQHIRRERATSNICTNHSLMALAFSIAVSCYGKNGFIEAAGINQSRLDDLIKSGMKVKFDSDQFNETVFQFPSEKELDERMAALHQKKIYPGVKLSRWYPEYEGCLLTNVTELHHPDDITTSINGLRS